MFMVRNIICTQSCKCQFCLFVCLLWDVFWTLRVREETRSTLWTTLWLRFWPSYHPSLVMLGYHREKIILNTHKSVVVFIILRNKCERHKEHMYIIYIVIYILLWWGKMLHCYCRRCFDSVWKHSQLFIVSCLPPSLSFFFFLSLSLFFCPSKEQRGYLLIAVRVCIIFCMYA